MSDKMELLFDHVPWVQLNWMARRVNYEISFLAQSHHENPLHVIALHMPKQVCSPSLVTLDEEDLGRHMDEMSQLTDPTGKPLTPASYFRIWIHTHPNMSPIPSGTDKETFKDTFSDPDWAVMCILSTDGPATALLALSSNFGNQRITTHHDLKVSYTDLQNLEGGTVCYDLLAWEALLKAQCSEEPSFQFGYGQHQRGLLPHYLDKEGGEDDQSSPFPPRTVPETSSLPTKNPPALDAADGEGIDDADREETDDYDAMTELLMEQYPEVHRDVILCTQCALVELEDLSSEELGPLIEELIATYSLSTIEEYILQHQIQGALS